MISDKDTDLMDSMPKEQRPRDLWIKLGFNPPPTQG